jgi:hypothetical protein
MSDGNDAGDDIMGKIGKIENMKKVVRWKVGPGTVSAG